MKQRKPWEGKLPPFQIFGNLYFVGTIPTSCHILKTSEGLVMFDCGYQESLYLILENMRRLGLNPADLKALFLTHGHIDHCGAAASLQEYTGCRIYLGERDLTYVDDSLGNTNLSYDVEFGMKLLSFNPNVLLHDGDKIRIGDSEIRCVATPGHTPGAMSFFFPVTDGRETFVAGLHGGMGINTLGKDYLVKYNLPFTLREEFVHSMERLQTEKVDIFLGNHAEHNHTADKMKKLQEGDAYAFVKPEEWAPYSAWCIENYYNMLKKETGSDDPEKAGIGYDANMIVKASIKDIELELHDIRKPPFRIYGLHRPLEEEWFIRMPREISEKVSEGVARASLEPSGGVIRFSTDSQYIAIKTQMKWVGYSTHIPLLETGAFDLYVDTPEGSHFERPFVPPYGMKDGYEQVIKFRSSKMRYITINFPCHSLVRDVQIGVCPGAKLGEGMPYRNQKPVVCYGSSITHGTGASRPGLTYPNILSRKLNLQMRNFGFSGQCKGENAMADFLCGLEMSAFIMEYDENAPTPEYLEETHEPFYRKIRAEFPKIPIIFISRPNTDPESMTKRRFNDVVQRTYEKALADGDQNVFYVDGGQYFKPFGYDDGILDGVHPNDLGYHAMTEAILPFLKQAIAENKDFQNG